MKKGNILFGWEDLIAGQPLKKLTAAFDAAGATIVSSSSDGKAKRTAGVSYKTLDIAFADSQQIELQVKQTGDVFQVKLNGQVVPLKNPDDHKAAIKELVAKMDAGRAKFQKKLTMVRAELPKGTKSVAPQKTVALAARVSELDAAINEATVKRDALKAEVAAVMDSVDEIFDAAHDYSDDELEEMQKWFDGLPKSAQERVMSGGVMIDKKAGYRASAPGGKLRITMLDSAEFDSVFINPMRSNEQVLDGVKSDFLRFYQNDYKNPEYKIDVKDDQVTVTFGTMKNVYRVIKMQGRGSPSIDCLRQDFVAETGKPLEKRSFMDGAGNNSTDLDNPAYTTPVKLPGQGKVTAINAHSAADGAKILNKLRPDWTKADHLNMAAEHEDLAESAETDWGKLVASEFKKLFDRDYRVGDYKVSGVARDEFPATVKDELRELNRQMNGHKSLRVAHAYAAKHYGKGETALDYAGQPRDTDGTFASGKKNSIKAGAQHLRFAVKRAFSNPFRK